MTSSNRQSFFERVGITTHKVPTEVTGTPSTQQAPSKPKFEFNFGLDRPETYGSVAETIERDPTSNDRKHWRSKASDQTTPSSLGVQLLPTLIGDADARQADRYEEAQHPTLAFALKKIRTYS